MDSETLSKQGDICQGISGKYEGAWCTHLLPHPIISSAPYLVVSLSTTAVQNSLTCSGG